MKSYRAAVGPPDKYDIIGALQFRVMVSEGLRDYHYLCDIGCGSLRGGRLFIPYLLPGHYCGIEPQRHLVWEGIDRELGHSIIKVKRPTFHYSGNFDLRHFGCKFHYILAQSIFSHASPAMIDKCLESVRSVLKPNGTFIATYFHGDTNYKGTAWAQAPDARYTGDWMRGKSADHNLSCRKLGYSHPSNQTWIRMAHK